MSINSISGLFEGKEGGSLYCDVEVTMVEDGKRHVKLKIDSENYFASFDRKNKKGVSIHDIRNDKNPVIEKNGNTTTYKNVLISLGSLMLFKNNKEELIPLRIFRDKGAPTDPEHFQFPAGRLRENLSYAMNNVVDSEVRMAYKNKPYTFSELLEERVSISEKNVEEEFVDTLNNTIVSVEIGEKKDGEMEYNIIEEGIKINLEILENTFEFTHCVYVDGVDPTKITFNDKCYGREISVSTGGKSVEHNIPIEDLIEQHNLKNRSQGVNITQDKTFSPNGK